MDLLTHFRLRKVASALLSERMLVKEAKQDARANKRKKDKNAKKLNKANEQKAINTAIAQHNEEQLLKQKLTGADPKELNVAGMNKHERKQVIHAGNKRLAEQAKHNQVMAPVAEPAKVQPSKAITGSKYRNSLAARIADSKMRRSAGVAGLGRINKLKRLGVAGAGLAGLAGLGYGAYKLSNGANTPVPAEPIQRSIGGLSPEMMKTLGYTGGGALAGALTGGLMSRENKLRNALLGATIGGLGGYAADYSMKRYFG